MKGLCYRCEHRAEFMENGTGPRAECKMKDMSVHSCYMYKPVRPLVLTNNEGDSRPPAGSIISARGYATRIADLYYRMFAIKGSNPVEYYGIYRPKIRTLLWDYIAKETLIRLWKLRSFIVKPYFILRYRIFSRK